MGVYVVKRILSMIPTIIGVSLLVFLLMELIPGSVVEQMLGIEGNNPEAQKKLEEFFGLNEPFYVQYWNWISGVIVGDLGVSWRSGDPILPTLLNAFIITGEMAVFAVIVSVIIGMPFGILAALKPYGIIDNILRVLSLAGVSIPVFFQGTLLILIFSLFFPWAPPVVYQYPWESLSQNLQIMILPAIALGIASSAVVMRMTRSSLLETLGQDFIRTARSKGITETAVIFGHALKNIWISVITAIGLEMGQILGGVVVVEVVFSLPGVGQLIFNSLVQRDFPIVIGGILFVTIIVLIINTMIDLIYKFVDPRIRYD
ncbi:ABC transporter permease [Schinkia azotoformans]|uniref:Binding-protein-dependent transporters inner membrane component n=1 Tax=Schinkia azotoformans LMG 9581 TaxID=1131731 RepID=K6D5Y2_SCHAZ|nr:ABC transporter permease [Schinkia azotoformans]EKN63448.1 binding-protein-dependent transporters inner membrane component [Schinkia azotoformans LMG 9581]MEC1638747.1 ABC transporter permease [Schinkia azotoformans]MEC1946712.1 ABC transporter permease [Schinkia azotoformans]